LIYFVGDTHGILETHRKIIQNKTVRQASKDDFVIVCGDFGMPFLTSQAIAWEEQQRCGTHSFPNVSYIEQYISCVKTLNKQKYTLLFIDGNHDNHDFWEAQPTEEWHGGKVHKHPHIENCYHLMRGEIYDIDGKKVFTFGGALSIDKEFRSRGYDWWEQEEANQAEVEYAMQNLENHGNSVDIIVTHTIPQSLIYKLDSIKSIKVDQTAKFLDIVYASVQYSAWVAGHFHQDVKLPESNMNILYQNVKSIDML